MSEEPGAAPPAPDLPPESVPETAPAEAEPAPAPEPAPQAPVEAPAADPTPATPAPVEPAPAGAGALPPTAPVVASTGGTGGGRNAMIIGAVIVGAMTNLNRLLGPKRPSEIKGTAFECGNDPTGPAWGRISATPRSSRRRTELRTRRWWRNGASTAG